MSDSDSKSTALSTVLASPNYDLAEVFKDQEELVAFQEAIVETLEDDAGALTNDRIRFPTSGSRNFTIPTADSEDGVEVEELRGVVIYHHVARGYWPGGEFKGSEPPACSSVDGKEGIGDPGGDCRTCPFNAWGSDERGGDGKACKEMRRVFILLNGQTLPMPLSLPPTSLKDWGKYSVRLLRDQSTATLGVRGVVTRIGTVMDKNSDGVEYRKATFLKASDLDKDVREGLRAYSNVLAPMLQRRPVESSEYVAAQDADQGSDDDGTWNPGEGDNPEQTAPESATVETENPDDLPF